MPVAEDILETDAAGQALVERTDRNFGDVADEIGLVHRIGLVARDDAGDAAAGDADDGELQTPAASAAIQAGTETPDAVREALDEEAR